MEEISIEDFSKAQIKIGKVVSAEEMTDSEKLVKFEVDLGEERPRVILSGIKGRISDFRKMVGRLVPVVTNLPARQIMGISSDGMILYAIGKDGTISALHPFEDIETGSAVR